jgi:hypothetical protein
VPWHSRWHEPTRGGETAEREFNAALIAASVNEHAFQAGASIRNYLAQTAFS